jgi:drug/metabolite transporter (DMT)-like permease
MNPLASLVITYLTGAAVSCALYFILDRDASLFREIRRTNWAPVVLGVVIVGLEVGFIYAFRAGWQVGTTQIITSAVVAVLLIFVGYLLYHEAITWNKIAGIIICLAGLVLINIR